jgi:hypothetical protein
MTKVKYFKAQRRTNRFNENQKVWIRMEYANHLEIYFRWRGKGRYVGGTIDKFASAVGEIKEIDVDDFFAKRVRRLR